jgi:hypothetical protein
LLVADAFASDEVFSLRPSRVHIYTNATGEWSIGEIFGRAMGPIKLSVVDDRHMPLWVRMMVLTVWEGFVRGNVVFAW